MDKETIYEKVKGFIGAIAWWVYLWSISKTEDEYRKMIFEQEHISYYGQSECRCK